MQISEKASSLIEVMIAMLIITVWIIWLYTINDSAQKLSSGVKNRIQAVSIAREWLEATTNIRDTNFKIYPWDTKNCWNIQNYVATCLWDTSSTNRIQTWSYIIYQNTDNRWYLEKQTQTW